MKQQVVPEVWVLLHLRVLRENRPQTVGIFEKDPLQTACDLLGSLVDRDQGPGACRAFDAKVIAVIMMKFLQGFDQEKVHRKPDRAAPVRVAAEDP